MRVRNQFMEQYSKCFDDNGNILNCGREACKKLILLAQKLTQVDCGDAETGRMNKENIVELHHRLNVERLMLS